MNVNLETNNNWGKFASTFFFLDVFPVTSHHPTEAYTHRRYEL